MIEKVTFMSQSWAQDLRPKRLSAMISITNPGTAAPKFAVQAPRFLHQQFSDFDRPDPAVGTFNMDQAAQLIEFAVALHAEPQAYELNVHCTKGQSRSAGVAKWIAKHFGVGIKGAPADIGTRLANRMVYEMLSMQAASLGLKAAASASPQQIQDSK